MVIVPALFYIPAFTASKRRRDTTLPCLFIVKRGQGEIRTHGTRNGFNGFRDRPIQPLWHLSNFPRKDCEYTIFGSHASGNCSGKGEGMFARL